MQKNFSYNSYTASSPSEVENSYDINANVSGGGLTGHRWWAGYF